MSDDLGRALAQQIDSLVGECVAYVRSLVLKIATGWFDLVMERSRISAFLRECLPLGKGSVISRCPHWNCDNLQSLVPRARRRRTSPSHVCPLTSSAGVRWGRFLVGRG
jgi:hypothetical protein